MSKANTKAKSEEKPTEKAGLKSILEQAMSGILNNDFFEPVLDNYFGEWFSNILVSEKSKFQNYVTLTLSQLDNAIKELNKEYSTNDYILNDFVHRNVVQIISNDMLHHFEGSIDKMYLTALLFPLGYIVDADGTFIPKPKRYSALWDMECLKQNIEPSDENVISKEAAVQIVNVLDAISTECNENGNNFYDELIYECVTNICKRELLRTFKIADSGKEHHIPNLRETPLTLEQAYAMLSELVEMVTGQVENIIIVSRWINDTENAQKEERRRIAELMEKNKEETFKKENEETNAQQEIIENLEHKIAELEGRISKQKEDYDKKEAAYKATASDRYSALEQKLSEAEEKFLLLTTKYEEACEYISELTDIPEEQNESVSEEEHEKHEVIRNLRLVFVRDKVAEKYLIMKKIGEYFPNSKFTDTISKKIDFNKTDAVIFMTRYTEHRIYNGTRDSAEKAGVPCVHCPDSNLQRITSVIFDTLIDKF